MITHSDHQRQLYNDKTTYYMTGDMFGCIWSQGDHRLDQDFESYQCYYSKQTSLQKHAPEMVGEFSIQKLDDSSSIADWDLSGSCSFNVRSSNIDTSFTTHDACTVDWTGVEFVYVTI